MSQVIADQGDIDFVLYEQLEIEELLKNARFDGFDKESADMIISEGRKLAIKEILPTLAAGDKDGARFENGQVKLPESYRTLYEHFKEGGWIAMTPDPEFGGQGMPSSIAQAVWEYQLGANYQATLLAIGSLGAGEIIESFGTEEQKDMYVEKLYSGEWGGTMAMTEPEAGSDVGALTTTAVKNQDGTYSISGNKIFITNAEHDLTENIIHPVLARIEGAPKGAKGISLFVVPKVWVNEDGTMGEPNDVVCTGIEEKMGMHASPTCSLTLGGNGNCRGLLLGEEHKGMRVMFHLMNAARLLVGTIGHSSGSAAYLHALNYAKERMQGRDLEKAFDPEAPQVPIIQHPDIRRMLLWMKAHVEGMRSLLFFGAMCIDRENSADSEQEKAYHRNLLDLLTPVIKAYCTDRGFQICSEALQVFGGYGYTKDFPVEQLLRDVRIASIYEGTNGIQAMDLLARKIGMNDGEVFKTFLGEIEKIIARARETGMPALADQLEKAKVRLEETALHLGQTASSGEFKAAFSFATPFQEAMGDVIMGWMLLWRAVVAREALTNDPNNIKADFYEGQLKTAEYFIQAILPTTMGKMDAIENCTKAVVNIPEESF